MIEIKGKLVEKPGPLDWLTGGDMTMRTLTGALRQLFAHGRHIRGAHRK